MTEPLDEQDAAWMRKFAAEISLARRELGWTQERLGEELGLSRSSIANIEAGRQNLSAPAAARVVALLGMDVPRFELTKNPLRPDLLSRIAEVAQLQQVIDRARGALTLDPQPERVGPVVTVGEPTQVISGIHSGPPHDRDCLQRHAAESPCRCARRDWLREQVPRYQARAELLEQLATWAHEQGALAEADISRVTPRPGMPGWVVDAVKAAARNAREVYISVRIRALAMRRECDAAAVPDAKPEPKVETVTVREALL